MALGQDRVERTQDGLRGTEPFQPVTRQVPGISGVQTPQQPVDSFGARVANKLQQFATGKLAEQQEANQRRSMRDGQLAAMQGEAFENVEMEGDKWALEGYRAVTAQTMSAGLLRAQEQEIADGLYESDPEAYRERLNGRLTALTDGITDQRTKDLVEEQFMQNAPLLVDSHMKQNLAFKEQQNFDALSLSLDTLSKDNNSTDALVGFATGTSSATAGLSQERRREAVVQGVVTAFQNGNPAAYAKLEASGMFTPENMGVRQLKQIEAAKSEFQSKMESEYNAEWTKENIAIEDAIKGGLDEDVAVERIAKNNAKHWHRNTQQQLGQVYENARNGRELNEATRGMNITAAGVRGNYRGQADLMMDSVVHQESRGDGTAVSPKGARGIAQIMPATAMKPGYGLKSIFELATEMGVSYSIQNEAEANKLMHNDAVGLEFGKRYLARMLQEFDGNTTAALASYNMGPGATHAWIARGGNVEELNPETKNYVKKISASWTNDIPDPNAERVLAQTNLESAREGAAMAAYEGARFNMDIYDQEYKDGTLSQQDWMDLRRGEMASWGMAVDSNVLARETSLNREVVEGISKKAEAGTALENELKLGDDLAALDAQYQSDLAKAANSPSGVQAVFDAGADFRAGRAAAYEANGVTMNAGVETRARGLQDEQAVAAIEAVSAASAARQDKVLRDVAVSRGMLGSLSPEQQKKSVSEFDAQLKTKYADFIAKQSKNGNTGEDFRTEEQLAVMMTTERNQFLAQAGVVDETTKRVLNAGMDQPILIDGKVNPAVLDSVNSYMQLKSTSQYMADKYLDERSKGMMYAITGRVGAEGNVSAAILTYGMAQANASSAVSTAKTPEEFMANRSVQGTIVLAAKEEARKLAFGDPAREGGRNPWDKGVHREGFEAEFSDVLSNEIAQVQKYHPTMGTDSIVGMATDAVKRQYAYVGNNMLNFGRGNDGFHSFFGPQADQMRSKPDAINTAIANYVTTPEFREKYPMINQKTFMEFLGPTGAGMNYTGARPYEVGLIPDGRGGTTMALYIDDPYSDGMSAPILLDPSEVGQAELKRLKKKPQ